MKKPMIIAGAFAWTCALALSSTAESGMVDIELKVDRAQSAESIYELVLEKAEDICGVDKFCEQDLINALVDAIDNEEVKAIHQATESMPAPILVAASE